MECEKGPGLRSEGAHPPAEARLPRTILWGDMCETRPPSLCRWSFLPGSGVLGVCRGLQSRFLGLSLFLSFSVKHGQVDERTNHELGVSEQASICLFKECTYFDFLKERFLLRVNSAMRNTTS